MTEQPTHENIAWISGLADFELVDVLLKAGRIRVEDADYWLRLIAALRSPTEGK